MNDLFRVSFPSSKAKFTNGNTQRRCTIPLEIVLSDIKWKVWKLPSEICSKSQFDTFRIGLLLKAKQLTQ
jgi:hypothetical protein